MGHQLDVCVLDREGNPAAGVPVTLVISGFLRCHQLESTTGRDGYAFFETTATYEQSSPVIIQVDGRQFGPYSITQERWTVRV
jgi:hypothetical protein